MVLNIAILGAGGIGRYHVREFANAGCEVSIFGRTKESVNQVAQNIKENFGIAVKSYYDLEEMLDSERPNAISICTPPETHEELIRKCLGEGLHVMCEKPLISGKKIYHRTSELLDLAQSVKRILTVNTQWPSILEGFRLYGIFDEPIKKLEIYMEPGERGKEMLIDHLPHANSISMKLVKGRATETQFEKKDKEEIIINFNYGACKVKYHFRYNSNRPRKLELIFNGKKFARKVGEDYQQSFEREGKTIRIEDPLAVSIRKFLGAIERKEPPLIEKDEILESAKLTELILTEYNKT